MPSSEGNRPIRLLVAFDQLIDRAGIQAVVDDTGIEIVGQVDNVRGAMEFCDSNEVDVLLCEYELVPPQQAHPLAMFTTQYSHVPVLVFSALATPRYIATALASGSSGYLVKDSSKEELIKSIKSVADGGQVWSQRHLRQVPSALSMPRENTVDDVTLTRRELQVLRCLVQGKTNEQIAKDLEIGYETAKEHVQHILRKLHVWTRTQAALWAVHHNVVE